MGLVYMSPMTNGVEHVFMFIDILDIIFLKFCSGLLPIFLMGRLFSFVLGDIHSGCNPMSRMCMVNIHIYIISPSLSLLSYDEQTFLILVYIYVYVYIFYD